MLCINVIIYVLMHVSQREGLCLWCVAAGETYLDFMWEHISVVVIMARGRGGGFEKIKSENIVKYLVKYCKLCTFTPATAAQSKDSNVKWYVKW